MARRVLPPVPVPDVADEPPEVWLYDDVRLRFDGPFRTPERDAEVVRRRREVWARLTVRQREQEVTRVTPGAKWSDHEWRLTDDR